MKNSLIFLLSFIALNLNAQCDELKQRFDFPVAYSIQSPLTPDPCDALSDYGTNRVLSVSPTEGYLEVKKRVKVVSETTWDADNCIAATIVLSRDTITISERVYPSRSDVKVGGFWTVRMELLILPPNSRPAGTYATKLPKGAMSQIYKNGSQIDLNDYWVIHTGQFDNPAEAKVAVKKFKELHPEFCRAYAYFLPSGCDTQYSFSSKNL